MQEMFLRGGVLMWPLLGCSVLSLAITMERLWFWWRENRRRDPEGLDRMLARVEAGEAAAVAAGRPGGGSSRPPDYVARIIVSGLSHRELGVRESFEIAAEEEMERMKQGLDVLDTIITMAPLLGILGTVLGIISSFNLLGSSGIEDPKAVTGGIAQALITTAAGLTVALVTLVPFNYFVAKVNAAARAVNKTAARFEAACRKNPGGGCDDSQRV